MGKTTTVVLSILAILTVISLFVNLAVLNSTPTQIDTGKLASDVAKLIVVPSAPAVDTGNLSAKVDALTKEVNEDDDFKLAVLDLATNEYERNKDKAVFNAINDYCTYKITAREDISSIVVDDSSVRRIDVDEGNAKIFQELKVKYEAEDGSNKKCYLDVSTVVKDSEVDSQVFALHV